MNRLTDIIAKILSVALYPLFVPTYGVALFCYAYSLQFAPLVPIWMIIALVGTFLLTCILPITAIWVMMRRGEIKDLYIEDPRQRTMPYLYSAFGFGFWCYLLISVLHAPTPLRFICVGATLAIVIVMLINRYWKISAHLAGIGGLVGGIFCYCMSIGAVPTVGAFCFWLGLSLLLMFARLRLNAHTPAQVSTGWLLGIACTTIPYCIFTYVV